MALNANNVSNDNGPRQEVLEPDVYPGRVVQVIDFGLQAQRPYQGQEKPPAQEIGFTYELSEEFMKDANGKDQEDKPRWLSESMPLFNLRADKAKSSLRYKAFDPSGAFNGDFSKVVGVPVNITVVNKTSNGKTYNNVGDVASMSSKKAEKLPPLKNEGKVFDLDNPDLKVFEGFPQWVRDKITSNLNYEGSRLQALLKGKPAEEKPAEVSGNNPF